MFLVHAPAKAKQLSSRARTAAPVIYDALFRPLTADEAMWHLVSEAIRRVKCVTADDPATSSDRELMHRYAASYMKGTLQEPTSLRNRQLACRARSIVDVQRYHYRMTHPWRARRTAVAA